MDSTLVRTVDLGTTSSVARFASTPTYIYYSTLAMGTVRYYVANLTRDGSWYAAPVDMTLVNTLVVSETQDTIYYYGQNAASTFATAYIGRISTNGTGGFVRYNQNSTVNAAAQVGTTARRLVFPQSNFVCIVDDSFVGVLSSSLSSTSTSEMQ